MLPLVLEETLGHSDRPTPWVLSVTSTGPRKTALHLALSAQPLRIPSEVSSKSNTSDPHSQAHLLMSMILSTTSAPSASFAYHWLCLRRLSHVPANGGPMDRQAHRVCCLANTRNRLLMGRGWAKAVLHADRRLDEHSGVSPVLMRCNRRCAWSCRSRDRLKTAFCSVALIEACGGELQQRRDMDGVSPLPGYALVQTLTAQRYEICGPSDKREGELYGAPLLAF